MRAETKVRRMRRPCEDRTRTRKAKELTQSRRRERRSKHEAQEVIYFKPFLKPTKADVRFVEPLYD